MEYATPEEIELARVNYTYPWAASPYDTVPVRPENVLFNDGTGRVVGHQVIWRSQKGIRGLLEGGGQWFANDLGMVGLCVK